MFRADILVFHLAGFFLGHIHHPLESRRDKDLRRLGIAIGIVAGLRGALQHCLQFADNYIHSRFDGLQNLRDRAVFLLRQCQEHVLGINLGMFIMLQDFIGPHSGFLRFFGKSIKSHHGC